MKLSLLARSLLRALLAAPAALLLAGCAGPPLTEPGGDVASSSWASHSGPVLPAGIPVSWEHQLLPGKKVTVYRPARRDGRDAIEVRADASASALRTRVRVEPADLGRLRFSWWVPQLPQESDIGAREHDDAVVRVVLAFEGDRSRFSPRDAMLAELVRAVTGEEMPYATLMYVWCNQRAPGTVVANPRTGRIRQLVVESGEAGLRRWRDYERDVRADFERAFGEPPGPLVGIAIMSDSDNTRGRVQAWYGPVQLLPPAP